MKRELDEQLCAKYPGLYRDRHGDKMKTLMCWGFCCGDGWYDLLDVVSELMSKTSDQITAVQVKEKFGSLRFYHHPVNDYSLAVEIAAELLSTRICEVCSAPAVRHSEEGWISTLCEKHSENYLIDEDKPADLSKVQGFGLGKFWSEMALMLIEMCEWNTEKNDMPEAALDFKIIDKKLVISISGGDESTKGAADVFAHYANSVNEHTGLPTKSRHEKLGSE